MDQFEREQLALAAEFSTPNRNAIAGLCQARGIPVASHDDATAAHVAESHAVGSAIAEFPPRWKRPAPRVNAACGC